jgi:hypothetical protein
LASSGPAPAVGLLFTVRILLQTEVHPVALETVTLYVPAAVRLQITAPVVGEKPAGPVHEYVKAPLPPVAVKQVDEPWHIVLLPAILQLGTLPKGPPTKSSNAAVIS